jgi:hypothetical protein
MKKLKLIAGIIWAFLGLILIIILFPKLTDFSKVLAGEPFMKINPRYTGGEVAFREVNQACTLEVRKPVFNGLFRERKKGFVQVDWKGKIPERFTDTIDYDQDKVPDFIVRIDRTIPETSLKPLNNEVENIGVSTPASFGWVVRINLKR